MKLSKHQIGILAIVANTFIWSAGAPILKWSMADIEPFSLAFFRFFIATLIILPFIIHKLKIKREHFYKLFVLSIVGIVAHITFYYLGLSIAPSINYPIIASITPFMLIIGAMLLLNEKPKRKIIYGTCVSLIGFIIIIIRPIFEQSDLGSILGNIYFILSVATLVVYTILLKKYNLPYSFPVILFWTFSIGTVIFFPMALFETQGVNPLVSLELRGSIGILYGAIFCSVIGYFLYNYAVEHIKAQEVGIFTYLDPFATAIVAIPLLGETITASYLLGSLFVFTGIYIAEGRLPYHPVHKIKQH